MFIVHISLSTQKVTPHNKLIVQAPKNKFGFPGFINGYKKWKAVRKTGVKNVCTNMTLRPCQQCSVGVCH